MFYIFLTIFAQFMYALVVLGDKYLLSSKSVPRPLVYTFYMGVLSSVVIVLLPFQKIIFPSPTIIWTCLVTGLTYIFSILFFYKSLQVSDASDVAPVFGAIAAFFTFIFSFLILDQGLKDNFLISFILLVSGTLLMSYFRLNLRSIFYIVFAGILWGLSSVYVKNLFSLTDFINGFFWSRMANFFMALTFLLWPSGRKSILENIKEVPSKTKFLILGNKTLAGIAFLLILFAIDRGNVSIVSALGGIQFIFLLFFALVFTKKFPGYFYESVHHKAIVLEKTLATVLIVFGLLFLFV